MSYLIVGLGNPGKRFDFTRHNAGFMAMDVLAAKLGAKISKIKFQSLMAETMITTGEGVQEKLVLLKPQTFMNNSGEAVLSAVNYYDIPPKNVLIIYDDVDIALGTIRLRSKGSAGTHNGMRNIIYHLQTDQFPRLRIGIAGSRKGELYDYVLGRFQKEEEKSLFDALDRSVEAALCFVEEGIDRAMNKHNLSAKKPSKKAIKPADGEETLNTLKQGGTPSKPKKIEIPKEELK